jgi:hypothetical protein
VANVVDVELVRCSEGCNTLVEGWRDSLMKVVWARCWHPVDLAREERYDKLRRKRRIDA